MHALAPRGDLVPPIIVPQSLDDIFEVITRAVFQAGLDWAVVDRRWEAFDRALEGFDAYAVAAWTADDVERLMQQGEIVRNRPKLEATRCNARELVAIEREHGTFADWLAEFDDYEAACAALSDRFAYLGTFGSTWALHVLGEEVPPHADWSRLGKRAAAA